MSGYWITGVVPLYATALLPMFAGPIMGLQTSGTLSREYLPVRDPLPTFEAFNQDGLVMKFKYLRKLHENRKQGISKIMVSTLTTLSNPIK